MKSNPRKVNDNSPIDNFLVLAWFKVRFLEFSNLFKMAFFRYPLQSIKSQVLWLLAHDLIYPLPRIILGKQKSQKLFKSFLNIYRPTITSLPYPLRSKITIPWGDFGLYPEIYLENIYSQELLKKGMNVIDIGAHIGTYTILAAEKVGKNGKVIAVEPETKNYKQLVKNIRINNFKNVIPKNIALANYNGSGKLYISSSSDGNSLIFPESKSSYAEVPVKTIDKLLEELNIQKIDIIKIDAEGVEVPILKGAEKTLKANPNVKMFIASYHYPSEIREVSHFLNERGFKVKVSERSIVTVV